MMSVFLAGGGYDDNDIVVCIYPVIFLAAIATLLCIPEMMAFLKYKKSIEFVKRCTKRTTAKVIDTSIDHDKLSSGGKGKQIKILVEINHAYEYEINDVTYKNHCLLPYAYTLSGKEITNIGINNGVYGKDGNLLNSDGRIKKIGDEVEIYYNPDKVDEFYCVGDERYIEEMSEVADTCCYKTIVSVVSLIILIIIAIYNGGL